MNESEPRQFPPLELDTRVVVDTATAAHHCNRRPQSMRAWACLETGPLRPIHINGRLAWRVSDIRQLLGCAAPSKNAKHQADSCAESNAPVAPQTNGEK
jgi:hypothetical protein